MKARFVFLIHTAAVSIAVAQARAPKTTPPPPPAPPPVFIAPAQSSAPAAAGSAQQSAQQYVYEQKPAAGRPYLVTPEQAQTIIDRFKETYPKLGSPRILIYINRELVDEEAGMKLSARKQQTETSGDVERATNKNTYRVRDRKRPTLADRQTARDVERLFGRPLRLGGATIVDQRVATQLIADPDVNNLVVRTEGEAARKDREALAKIADVVLEILISSRQVSVPELSGTKTYTVPDIQATAIRLSDSRIVGQATSDDLVGDDRQAGRVARSFTVREITEATALALMEDMIQL